MLPRAINIAFQNRPNVDVQERASNALLLPFRVAFGHYVSVGGTAAPQKRVHHVALRIFAALFALALFLPFTIAGVVLLKCSKSHNIAYRALSQTNPVSSKPESGKVPSSHVETTSGQKSTFQPPKVLPPGSKQPSLAALDLNPQDIHALYQHHMQNPSVIEEYINVTFKELSVHGRGLDTERIVNNLTELYWKILQEGDWNRYIKCLQTVLKSLDNSPDDDKEKVTKTVIQNFIDNFKKKIIQHPLKQEFAPKLAVLFQFEIQCKKKVDKMISDEDMYTDFGVRVDAYTMSAAIHLGAIEKLDEIKSGYFSKENQRQYVFDFEQVFLYQIGRPTRLVTEYAHICSCDQIQKMSELFNDFGIAIFMRAILHQNDSEKVKTAFTHFWNHLKASKDLSATAAWRTNVFKGIRNKEQYESALTTLRAAIKDTPLLTPIETELKNFASNFSACQPLRPMHRVTLPVSSMPWCETQRTSPKPPNHLPKLMGKQSFNVLDLTSEQIRKYYEQHESKPEMMEESIRETFRELGEYGSKFDTERTIRNLVELYWTMHQKGTLDRYIQCLKTIAETKDDKVSAANHATQMRVIAHLVFHLAIRTTEGPLNQEIIKTFTTVLATLGVHLTKENLDPFQVNSFERAVAYALCGIKQKEDGDLETLIRNRYRDLIQDNFSYTYEQLYYYQIGQKTRCTIQLAQICPVDQIKYYFESVFKEGGVAIFMRVVLEQGDATRVKAAFESYWQMFATAKYEGSRKFVFQGIQNQDQRECALASLKQIVKDGSLKTKLEKELGAVK